MNSSTELPFSGALAAVQQIELAARERDQARQAADLALASAQEAAEKLVADAREAGRRAAKQRHDSRVAEAQADALVIRATAAQAADKIGEQAAAAPELLDRLTELLLLDRRS